MKVRQLTSTDSIKSDYLPRKQLLLTLPTDHFPLGAQSGRNPQQGDRGQCQGGKKGELLCQFQLCFLLYSKSLMCLELTTVPYPEPKDSASLPTTHVRNVRDSGILESTAPF